MNVQKVFVSVILLLAALFVCMSAAVAEIIETHLPEQVEICITETEDVEKLARSKYSVAVYPDCEELVIKGIWDGESAITVSLYAGGSETSECGFEKYDDGTWQCIIPVDMLKPNARNYFSIWYTDGSQETVSCEIIMDFVCELELDDVYAAEKRVTGTAEPGAEVYMYAGETEYYTVTGEDGGFWFDVDFSQFEGTEGWVVRAVDVYGNSAELGVSVIDAEITVSVPAMVNSEKVRVDVAGISGSSVQLTVNGEESGEIIQIDKNGKGHTFLTGLVHEGEYEISAVYTGKFSGYADPARPVMVVADMQGPVIGMPDKRLYEDEAETEIIAGEECTMVILDAETGAEYRVTCKEGSNIIDIGEIVELEYGMGLTVYAVDSIGNTSPEVFELEVRLQDGALVQFESMTITDGLCVDAMEPFSVECVVYAPDAGCGINVFVIDAVSGDMMLVNAEPFSAVAAEEGAVLPAMIPVEFTVDARELPVDHELSIGFCTVYADGKTDDIALWPKLRLTLEKNYAKLTALFVMLALTIICFTAAVVLYIRINNKQRELKRSNGALKESRRGRKRGGAWA